MGWCALVAVQPASVHQPRALRDDLDHTQGRQCAVTRDKEVRIRITRQTSDGSYVDYSLIIEDDILTKVNGVQNYVGYRVLEAINACNRAAGEEELQ